MCKEVPAVLIEDHIPLAEAFRFYFKSLGVDLHLYTKLPRNMEAQPVIMDIRLPGVKLEDQIAFLDKHHTYTVLISAESVPDEIRERFPKIQYLSKPFNIHMLQDAMLKMLQAASQVKSPKG